MLYITTRNDCDTYSADLALSDTLASDGGRYVPFSFPTYDADAIAVLQNNTFGQNVANILNLFFSTDLNGWDIDFCIGRNTARTVQLSNKLIVAEVWHNTASTFDYVTRSLYAKITNNSKTNKPTEWFSIATSIAVLFALYGDLRKQDILQKGQLIDISISEDDVTMPVAALYARKMGLPLGTIIISGSKNRGLWDLVHRGVAASMGNSAISDTVERLIHGTLGIDTVQAYLNVAANNIFTLSEEDFPALRQDLFCIVVSKDRTFQTINSQYRTRNYLLDLPAAACVAAVQDYRAKTGENNLTLVVSEFSPRWFFSEIAEATGLTETKLTAQINLS